MACKMSENYIVCYHFFKYYLDLFTKARAVHEGVGEKFNLRFFHSDDLSYSGRENRFQKYVVLTLLRETRMNYFDISHFKKNPTLPCSPNDWMKWPFVNQNV